LERRSPCAHGIDRRRHAERHRRGRVLGGESGGCCDRNDAIDPELDQLGGERREALRVAVREPALEDEVPPCALPALPQPVQERLPQRGGWGNRRQGAAPGALARWLRCSGEGGREKAEGEEHEERGGLDRLTSSAWKRIAGGQVHPRALAVVRLRTSSHFVGCATGRSAGLVPLRILSP